MRKTVMLRSALAAALLASAGLASATIITPGIGTVSGTTLAAQPQLAGTIVEDQTVTVTFFDFNSGPDPVELMTASLQSQVVLALDGTYDFYWRVFDLVQTGPSAVPVGSIRIGNFGTPIAGLNGGFLTDGPGDKGPDGTTTFVGDPNYVDAVNFSFSDPLGLGEESFAVFLDTQAKAYAKTASIDLANPDQTNSSRFNVETFGVAATPVVPEPATWAMMLGGFGLLGARLRRRAAQTSVRFA